MDGKARIEGRQEGEPDELVRPACLMSDDEYLSGLSKSGCFQGIPINSGSQTRKRTILLANEPKYLLFGCESQHACPKNDSQLETTPRRQGMGKGGGHLDNAHGETVSFPTDRNVVLTDALMVGGDPAGEVTSTFDENRRFLICCGCCHAEDDEEPDFVRTRGFD